jgi:hypothetical protein
MDLASWINELRVLLEELKEKNLGYPHGDNYVRPPGEKAVLQELLAKTGLNESSQIATFYRTCDGLSLPDVWNGYFIHPTRFTLNLERGPLSVSGPLACQILVFGSDGGGGLFCFVS